MKSANQPKIILITAYDGVDTECIVNPHIMMNLLYPSTVAIAISVFIITFYISAGKGAENEAAGTPQPITRRSANHSRDATASSYPHCRHKHNRVAIIITGQLRSANISWFSGYIMKTDHTKRAWYRRLYVPDSTSRSE